MFQILVVEDDRDLNRSVCSFPNNSGCVTTGCLTLILGFGMSLILTDLWATMGMSHPVALIVGCLFGLFGAIPMALAYPAHNFVLRRERGKIAPEIIRLTDELMK